MLTFSATQRIYLAVEPVDMRKQFNGLWTLAAQKLHEDPFSGALFVFVNKGRDRVKILFWDGTGLVMAYKRLEEGLEYRRLVEAKLNALGVQPSVVAAAPTQGAAQ